MNRPELTQPSADRPGATQSAASRPGAEKFGTPGSADPVALRLIPANVPGASLAPRPPDDFDPHTANRAALARYGLPWGPAHARYCSDGAARPPSRRPPWNCSTT